MTISFLASSPPFLSRAAFSSSEAAGAVGDDNGVLVGSGGGSCSGPPEGPKSMGIIICICIAPGVFMSGSICMDHLYASTPPICSGASANVVMLRPLATCPLVA